MDDDLVRNSRDMPDIDKFRLDKFCLDKCPCDSWCMLNMVPGAYFYSLVNIRSVIDEILLIWTNVARTSFALTNVIMTVGICSRWSQEPAFKVWSKSGQ